MALHGLRIRVESRSYLPLTFITSFCTGLIVGSLWIGAGQVVAHNAGRQEGHGDCASISASAPFDWELHGTPGGDACVGHGNRDLITTDGGRDSIQGDDGADEIRGGDDADTINGGRGGDNLIGAVGGGDHCGDSDPGTCERLDGGSGADRLDDADPDNLNDYDRICDGSQPDGVGMQDGDSRDKWLEDGNDAAGDFWFRDMFDSKIIRDVCPW